MQEKGIYLITGANQPFWPRAENYIKTINANSNIQNILITLDFDVEQKDKEKYNKVKFVRLNSSQVKSPNPNKCLQHGGFLSALDFISEEDIIIFTDADIKLQRPFSKTEIDFFRDISDNEIGVNYNRSKTDFLIEEAERLNPSLPISEIERRFPGISSLPTYNTGVIIAKLKTYLQLYNLYNKHWPEYENIFNKDAKQQWLLSYLINKDFKPLILPDLIHTHGKFPVELRVKEETDFKFTIDNKLVALNHYIQHPAEFEASMLNKEIRHLNRRISKLKKTLVLVSIFLIIFIIIALLH